MIALLAASCGWPLSTAGGEEAVLPPFLALENRIGFQFASLCLGQEDGSDSTIAGSHGRIETLAEYLNEEAVKQLKVHIDGHVGISCPMPAEMAAEYSEVRAALVAEELERNGVAHERISIAGWGLAGTERALTSTHPNARSAQAGFGWAEIFLRSPDGVEWPARPDYYYQAAASPPPPSPPPVSRLRTVPIFYMQPGLEVGERFGLHFFEPRYKLLARRIAEAQRIAEAVDGPNRQPEPGTEHLSGPEFLYCAEQPFAGLRGSLFNLPLEAALPASDTCVLARCDSLELHADGTADATGVGVEEVSLTEVLLEEGSGGLFSATLPAKLKREVAAIAESRKDVYHPCAAELSRCAVELGVAAGDGGECLLSHFETLSSDCRAFVATHLTPRVALKGTRDDEGVTKGVASAGTSMRPLLAVVPPALALQSDGATLRSFLTTAGKLLWDVVIAPLRKAYGFLVLAVFGYWGVYMVASLVRSSSCTRRAKYAAAASPLVTPIVLASKGSLPIIATVPADPKSIDIALEEIPISPLGHAKTIDIGPRMRKGRVAKWYEMPRIAYIIFHVWSAIFLVWFILSTPHHHEPSA